MKATEGSGEEEDASRGGKSRRSSSSRNSAFGSSFMCDVNLDLKTSVALFSIFNFQPCRCRGGHARELLS